MEKKREKISVCFYDFMKALGIRGTALTIYAFIYSYRKSEAGFFFVKRQFIADKCGISLRSVDRGIPKLLEMGLIERYECGKHKGFAVNEAYLPDKRAEFASEKKRAEREKSESYVHSICDDEPAPKRAGYDAGCYSGDHLSGHRVLHGRGCALRPVSGE